MRNDSNQTIEKSVNYAVSKIDYQKINQLSSKDKKYIREDNSLAPFYKYPANLESFEQIFADKEFRKSKRTTLVSALNSQYKSIGVSKTDPVWRSIQELEKDNVYTVITAHQPSLFTGPLYYVIKILSTINLAEQLNQKYPTRKVIPVFITGGEDHDFEEVNHLNLFGKTITWENDEQGSVGMMDTQSLESPLNQLFELLGKSENAETLKEIIGSTHQNFSKYSKAVVAMIHKFFGKYGLVILDMNTPILKKQFAPIIKDELFNQSSGKIVRTTIEQLEKVDYANQAFPRDINLFYLKDQMRNRIEFEDGIYKVLNSEISFSKEEIEKEVEIHPERFSPNVILRPVYQEYSLPNLAYIGGGGEIAYWLERKEQFEHYDLNFPMLIRRNSMLWIEAGLNKKISKLDLDINQIFCPTDFLIKNFVINSSEQTLNLDGEVAEIEMLFDKILEKTASVDKGLQKYVLAEKAKQLKTFKNIESKLIKAEKQRHEIGINQLRKMKNKLFPKDGLQERHDNFIPFYLKHGDSFFEILKKELNPMDKRFTVIVAD